MRAFILGIGLAISPTLVAPLHAQQDLRADPGSDYFARARQLYDAAVAETDPAQQKELYQRAIPILDDYIRMYPRHKFAQPATYYLAESYHAVGMPRQASMLFDQIIQKYRTGHYVAAAAYRLAYDNYNKKRYQQAARLFGLTAANAKKPEDQLRSIYFRAQCYLLLKDPKRAHPLLEKVANSPIDSPYKNQAKISSAHILLAEKKYDKALPLYEALLLPSQPPELRSETAYHAGVAAAALKKSELAKKYFDIAMEVKQSPWKANAHIALLGLYYQDKDYAAILNQLGKSQVKLDPKQLAQQGVIVGQTYFQKKDYAEAINYFLDVERSAPGTDQAFEAAYYKLLALYNIDGERIPEMVDQFIQNYAVGRGTSKYIHQAILMKAETLYGEKKYKEAAEAYNAISTEFIDKRNLPSLLYKKAWCLSEIGNHEGAATSFSQFIKDAPNDPRINNAFAKRGQSYMELGDRVKALKDFDAVIKNAPQSQIAAMSLQLSARIQRDAKRYEDVVERLEQLLRDFKDLTPKVKANSHYWLGSAYFKIDQFKNAIPHLETAQEMDKESYGKQTAMLLILARYSLKDVDGLKTALKQAEDIELTKQIPLPVYRWLGSQCYNAGDFKEAAYYLTKGCEEGVPQKTPTVVWRLLAKAQLKNQQWTLALLAADNLLTMEKEDARRVEAMLDKATALIGLNRLDEAKTVGEEALALRPSGKIKAGLLMALGDVAYLKDDFPTAAQHYVLVVETFDDEDASHADGLYKLIKSLEKSGKAKDAATYKAQLKKDHPGYQAPKGF
ncbi:tetratricopeptide repeat protein [Rubritalea tangerina]|uniref:Tetratricopeptide repeat protein n=1 Tax=Rubritalea tangerina TaxID=430798 RepID=A0ABW4ZE97_9BACT